MTTRLRLSDPKTASLFDRKGYSIENKLNEGSYGVVYKGRHRDGKLVAVKVMTLANLPDADYERRYWPLELSVMKSVHHINIIRVYDVFRAEGKLFVIMEFANGGDLSDQLKKRGPFPETLAAYWFTQACQAMDYMHKPPILIAHRDIKVENVLLHRWRAKITDFGFATRAKSERPEDALSSTRCGTQPYEAPQVIGHTHYNIFAADCYSMGVMLFMMLNHDLPFSWANPKRQLYEQKDGDSTLERRWNLLWDGRCPLSDEARHLMKRLMCFSERRRITMAETLKHPWIVAKGRTGEEPVESDFIE